MWKPSEIDTRSPLPPESTALRNRPTQRLLDLTLAVPALLVTAPLIAVAALAVTLSSKGGAFYRATRSGVDGKPFAMIKLRTMHTGTDDLDRRITARQDSRITPIGKLLRTLKIDELPQLWNVVRGEMSLIGPRPEDSGVVSTYYDEEMQVSLRVRPGMTSAASLYWYPDLMFHDPPPPGIEDQQWYLQRHMLMELRMDVHYELQRSLASDLVLLMRTPFTIAAANLFRPRKRIVEA